MFDNSCGADTLDGGGRLAAGNRGAGIGLLGGQHTAEFTSCNKL